MNISDRRIAGFFKKAVITFLAVNMMVITSPAASFAGGMEIAPAMVPEAPVKTAEKAEQEAQALPSKESSNAVPTSDHAMMMGDSSLSLPKDESPAGQSDLLDSNPQINTTPSAQNSEDKMNSASAEKTTGANEIQAQETQTSDINSDINEGIERAIAILEATKAGLLKGLEDIQKQIEEKNKDIERLNEQMKSIQDKVRSISDDIKENDDLIDGLAAKNVQGTNYCRRNPCTQQQLDQLMAWRQQIAQLKEANKLLRDQRADLNKQLRQKEDEIEAARKAINDLLRLKSFVEFSIQMIDGMIDALRKLLNHRPKGNGTPNHVIENPVVVTASPSPTPSSN